jgi:hypothetical protein
MPANADLFKKRTIDPFAEPLQRGMQANVDLSIAAI